MKKRCIGPALRILALLFLLQAAMEGRGQQSNERVLVGTADATRQALVKAYGNLPLSFEANQGQTDPHVKFQARGPGYAVFLASTEAVLVIPQRSIHPASVTRSETAAAFDASSTQPGSPSAADRSVVIRMQLVGSNASPRIVGLEQLAGRTNYLRGNDPAKWQTAVPQYTRVRYESVYPGIDVVYYGNQGQLEHDFLVAPGAQPGAITLNFEGAEKLEIDGRGDLVLHIRGGQVRLPKPHIHQSAGTRIAGGYVLKSKREVGFEVGPYDRDKPLVIDPVLVYSTHLGGGTLDDFFNRSAIAVDASGSAYVTGQAVLFPTTPGAFQPAGDGDSEVVVAKLAPDGSSLVYATFISGSSHDRGSGIAVDADGRAYVTGVTSSTDFPTTPGAFQRTNGCTVNGSCPGDAFVVKLNAEGSALLYSTYLGGRNGDVGYGIAIDGGGSAYVTGHAASSNFPVTPGTYRAAGDGFLTKLNAAGSGLVYSTFAGGGNGVAVDGAGNAYVAGWNDGCVNKLNSAASALVYSTCLGGSQGQGVAILDIALDTAGNAYVTGGASSTYFTATPDAIQTVVQGQGGAFVSKLNAMGSPVYSTFLATGYGSGIAVDGSGHVYVTGRGEVPVVDPFQVFDRGYGAAFVAELNPGVAGPAGLVFATALGGIIGAEGHDIAVDPSGNIYVSGRTRSDNFQLVDPLQSTVGGGFVVKIAPTASHADLALVMTSAPRLLMVGGDLTYTITVTNSGPDAAASVDVIDSFSWYATLRAYGSSQGSCAQNGYPAAVTCRLGALPAGGEATVTLVLTPQSSSTFRNQVTVRSNVSDPSPGDNSVVLDTAAIGFTPACRQFTCHFAARGVPPDSVFTFSWDFGDGTTGSGPTATRTYAAAGSYTVTLTVTDNDGGTGTQTQTVTVPVNEPPVAVWFTEWCVVGLTCTFDGSRSEDPDGTITDYTWDFGDGSSASSATVSHTYAVSDIYWVTLYVTDDQGATASQSGEVYVTAPPNAVPVAKLTSTCSGLTCSFDASTSSDSDGTIASYAWMFGDGAIGSGAALAHAYAAHGTYTVTVTVMDDDRAIDVATLTVTPNAPPRASFTSGCISLKCTFDGSASSDADGTIASYVWNFGDGSAASGQTVAHRYTASGNYVVTLTATDDDSLTGAKSQTLSVQALVPVDPAAEQIALTRLYVCDGVIIETTPPCSESVLMDADGTHVMPLSFSAAASPDGTKQLVSNGDIFLVSATGAMMANLTNHPGNDLSPAWSPDGARIAFASDRDGPLDLYVMNADGSNVVRLATGVGMAWKPTWSPNNTRLAFTCIVDPLSSPYWSATGDFDICAINADGSGFARLTNEPGFDSDPDWSPDGSRIVFVTSRFGGDVTEIVVMNPDDGDVTRIGSGLPGDTPSWSSDGTRIAFVSLLPWDPDQPWMPTSFVSIINADGTGLTSLAWGHSPAWRPWTGGINDRPVAAFTFECSGLTCTFVSSSSDADGTIASYQWPFIGSGATVTHTFEGGHIYPVQLIVMDDDGALATSIQSVDLNQRPVVRLTASCIGLTCEFDGSASTDLDGHITMFDWNFGDLIGRNGPAAMTHTYAAAGVYIVTLTARDNASGTGSYSETVTVVNPNAPPIAKFTSSCSGLVCSFNASTSSDSDGAIASYAWTFGDGTTGSGATVNRTYAAGGTYTVGLTVTDNGNATGTLDQSVTVVQPGLHVGDLDRSRTLQSRSWTAIVTIRIHGNSHGPFANALVSGSWNDGSTRSCTTNASGRCTVSRSGISNQTGSVSFTVTNVARATFVYMPAANHDPDGDSNGSIVTVTKL